MYCESGVKNDRDRRHHPVRIALLFILFVIRHPTHGVEFTTRQSRWTTNDSYLRRVKLRNDRFTRLIDINIEPLEILMLLKAVF